MSLFLNNKDNEDINKKEDVIKRTIIGKDAKMDGTINSNGSIEVYGNYNGDIFSKSDVIIGKGAFLKGNVEAIKVTIAGKIEGNVKTLELLHILSTGELLGDINVKVISMDEGAIFRGKSTMNEVKETYEFEDEIQYEIEENKEDVIKEDIKEDDTKEE